MLYFLYIDVTRKKTSRSVNCTYCILLTSNTNSWSLFKILRGKKKSTQKTSKKHFSLIFQFYVFSPCLILSLSSSSSQVFSGLGGWGGDISAFNDFCWSSPLWSCLAWVTQGHSPSWLPLTWCGPSRDCSPSGVSLHWHKPPRDPTTFRDSMECLLKAFLFSL